MEFRRKEKPDGNIFDLVVTDDDDADGMTEAALIKSRNTKKKFFTKYNFDFVPESILVADLRDQGIDPTKHTRSTTNWSKSYLKRRSKGEVKGGRKEKDLSGAVGDEFRRIFKTQHSSSRRGSLSKFPQNIARILINFHCPKDGIIIDLFAGHCSRMEAAYACKRHYVGVDVCHEFMEANRQVADILLAQSKNNVTENPATITLIEGSSDRVDLPNDYADFSITSPPYWKVESYGSEKEQLGNNKTYDLFIKAINRHIIENHRILKDKAYCVWCVNDFVWEGIYYAYHADLIPLFEMAGFRLHYIYIIDFGQTIQKVFTQRIDEWKTFPKRHEYVMVFQKSNAKKRDIIYEDWSKYED